MIKHKNHSNKFYYFGLIIINSLLLFFVFYKKKNRKTTFLTLLSIIGLAYYFEYPIYILRGYKYKTKILKNREQDNAFGSVLSQAIFVPSAAIFISTFKLGWKIKLLFTTFFVLIERFFIKIKIYENKWWHTTFTAIFIFTYFFISDRFYNGIMNRNKIILKLTLFNIIHITNMNILFIFSLFKKFKYQPVVTIHHWYYHYSFVKVYTVVETAVTTFLIEQKKKWLKTLPIVLMVLVDTYLLKIKKLTVKGSYWFTLFPIRIVLYLMSLLFQKWIKKFETDTAKRKKATSPV